MTSSYFFSHFLPEFMKLAKFIQRLDTTVHRKIILFWIICHTNKGESAYNTVKYAMYSKSHTYQSAVFMSMIKVNWKYM